MFIFLLSFFNDTATTEIYTLSLHDALPILNVLPFDVIKLDKSLIDYIGNESGDQIIQHVIALAHGLNMKVVAEGVEKKEQAAFLQNMNCDQIQGYYYSSPKSYEVFDKMI